VLIANKLLSNQVCLKHLRGNHAHLRKHLSVVLLELRKTVCNNNCTIKYILNLQYIDIFMYSECKNNAQNEDLLNESLSVSSLLQFYIL